MKPNTADAYKLVHEGALALSEVSAAGMRVDVDKLNQTIEEVTDKIEEVESILKTDSLWKVWKKKYGTKANIDSRHQLGEVLKKEIGKETLSLTKTGKTKTDEDALEKINNPFTKDYLKLQKLKKIK